MVLCLIPMIDPCVSLCSILCLNHARPPAHIGSNTSRRYEAIARPNKLRFFQSGHFSAEVDLAVIRSLQLGLSRSKAHGTLILPLLPPSSPSLHLVFLYTYCIGTPCKSGGPSMYACLTRMTIA